MNDLGLSQVQEGWARKILAVVKGHQLERRHGIIAIECAITESSLRMQANKFNPESLKLPFDVVGHDHGSVGLFQQQVGGAPHSNADWGTTAQLMDVRVSTHKFLKALLHVNLDLVTNWRACQQVQNSAFDGAENYRVNDALATRVVDAFWDGVVADTTGVDSPPPVPSGVGGLNDLADAGGEYTVRPGDTLSSIAAHFGVRWQELQDLNDLPNPNLIHPGQHLIVPSDAEPGPVSPVTGQPVVAKHQNTYTVQKGDTLFGIATEFGTTWQHLAKLNSLDNPRVIHPGQVLSLV
jgi:LysM repeat protein